jgi:DUF971 family protein
VDRKILIPLLGQPDPNTPKRVHLVGRYALGVDWADDHGSIYPFEMLRRTCACGACATLEALAQGMAWPEEINRGPEGLAVRWADAHRSLYPYADLRANCRCAGCTGGH